MFDQSPNVSTMNAFYTFILNIWETFLPKQLSEYFTKKHLVSTVYKGHHYGPQRIKDE